MNHTPVPSPLETLRQRLDECRTDGKRAVFADDLKWQAVALLNDYPTGVVQQALNISPSCLSRWRKQAAALDINVDASGESTITQDVGTFVSLPVSPSPARYPLTVTLVQNNSDQPIRFQCEVTLDQWREILTAASQALLS